MQERCQWAKTENRSWLEHYQRLLNVEFDCDPDHLSYQPPVKGPPIPITTDMVKAISQMKAGKAPGPSGIVVEMIRAAGDMGASMIRDLAVAIIRDGKVPSDWEQSFIVCLYKGKRGRMGKRQLPRSQADRTGYQKSWRGLWTASSDSWCQSTIPSLASSQAEALQTQSLLSGSCKRSI